MRVEDILEACRRVMEYTGGLSEEEFKHDSKTVDAVVRNLTVIGEAANHVPKGIQDQYNQLAWAEMHGIRNASFMSISGSHSPSFGARSRKISFFSSRYLRPLNKIFLKVIRSLKFLTKMVSEHR